MTGFFRNSALRIEAAAVLPILDILVGQLNEVSHEVEHSIVEICSHFNGMARQEREVVEHTQLRDEDGTSGAELVQMASEQLTVMLSRLEAAGDFSQRNAQTMSILRRGLDEVFDSLGRIEKISSKARIVALNGQMEAVRAGASGAAFAEVANQTRELAASVEASSSGIRESVDELGHRIVSMRDELEQHVETETSSLQDVRDAVTHALTQLASTQSRLEKGISYAEQAASSLARDIGQAVVSLQFQDAVCQRIAHVIYGIQAIHQAVSAHVDADATPRVQRRTQELLDGLSSQYTIASERNIHGSCDGAEEDEMAGSVELF